MCVRRGALSSPWEYAVPFRWCFLSVRLSTIAVPLSRRPWKTPNPCLLSPCDMPICVRGLSSLSLGPSRSCSFPRFLLCATLSNNLFGLCVSLSPQSSPSYRMQTSTQRTSIEHDTILTPSNVYRRLHSYPTSVSL